MNSPLPRSTWLAYLNAFMGVAVVFLLPLSLIPGFALAQTKTFTVNMTGDESDPNAGNIGDDGRCDVDPNTPGDQCTFRAAVENQNGNRNLGQNLIRFDIPNAPGTGSIVIQIGKTGLGPLPPILGSVAITAINGDGRRIELDGTNAGAGAIGLRLLGGTCQISFFIINNFSSHGIFISGTPPPGEGSHIIQSNYIGTDSTGTVAKGNGGDGIFIDNTPGNMIGGTGLFRNIISGNMGYGINLNGLDPNTQFGTNGAFNNLVTGNLIGLDITGEKALPNKKDAVILTNAPNNAIGGLGAGQGNKMAGDSTTNGVTVTGSITEGIKILGNFIGENKTGAKFAIGIAASAKPITIEGNFITDIAGVGIDLFTKGDGSYNIRKNSFEGNMTIGSKLRFGEGQTVQIMYQENFHNGNGTAMDVVESLTGKIDWLVAGDTLRLGQVGANFVFHAAGNKNFSNGLYNGNAGAAFNYVVDVSSGAQIALNVNADTYIANGAEGRKGKVILKAGTQFSYAIVGSSAVNNGKDGDRIDLFTDVNGIATLTSTDNRFAINGGAGVRWISDGKNLLTVRAFIERDLFDRNTLAGVEVTSFFTGKSILNDTITNNGGPGVLVDGVSIAHIAGSVISGNGIGIQVNDAATASIEGNTISANGEGIVFGGTGTGSKITANSIFNDLGLGIDLGSNGANNHQNFPVLTAAGNVGGNAQIQGTLNSTPNASFKLEFFANDICNPTGFGEGKTFIDSFEVVTDATGKAAFTAVLTGRTLPAGSIITATATDSNNNTSQFSACLPINTLPAANLVLVKQADKTQYSVNDQVVFTITLTNNGPANATGVVVTDLLPSGITFSSAAPSVGTYENTAGKWTAGTLNNGLQATLTITGIATQPGTITNTTDVTADNISAGVHQSSVSIQVTQPTDIAVLYKQLMDQVTALVKSGKLTPQEGRLLNGLLETSMKQEVRGKIRSAIALLDAFIIVTRNVKHKAHLTPADRNALIQAAQKIIDLLKPMDEYHHKEGKEDDAEDELKAVGNNHIGESGDFTLRGIFPNPFSSYAIISFELKSQSKVQLNVFDANGKMITCLLDKMIVPGLQIVTWETPNLPAGIYIIQLKLNNGVKTWKVMHMNP